MGESHWRRLTDRIAKGILHQDPRRVDPFWRREVWDIAGAVAELLTRKGAAWPVSELGLDEPTLKLLEKLDLATRWFAGGKTWLALNQRAADLGEGPVE